MYRLPGGATAAPPTPAAACTAAAADDNDDDDKEALRCTVPVSTGRGGSGGSRRRGLDSDTAPAAADDHAYPATLPTPLPPTSEGGECLKTGLEYIVGEEGKGTLLAGARAAVETEDELC